MQTSHRFVKSELRLQSVQTDGIGCGCALGDQQSVTQPKLVVIELQTAICCYWAQAVACPDLEKVRWCSKAAEHPEHSGEGRALPLMTPPRDAAQDPARCHCSPLSDRTDAHFSGLTKSNSPNRKTQQVLYSTDRTHMLVPHSNNWAFWKRGRT